MAKVLCEFDSEGREILDKTPVEMPLNYKEPPSIQEMIRIAIRTEMSRQAEAEGYESFEEADDFEVEDEEEVITQYELRDMQEEVPIPRSVRKEEVKPGSEKFADSVAGASGENERAPAGRAGGPVGSDGAVSVKP